MARDDAQFTAENRTLPTRVETARDLDEVPSAKEPFSPADLASPDDEQRFRRAQKRVAVRRGPLPKKAWWWIYRGVLLVVVVVVVWIASRTVRDLVPRLSTFRFESSDNVTISGLHNVTRREVIKAIGGDISKSVLSVSLEEDKKNLEKIPWVQSATVMRLLPNRIAVDIVERTPVAFVQIGSRVALIDGEGVIMDLPRGANYSFPVVDGMSDGQPLSTRSARMHIFQRLMHDLDSGGQRYSRDISEVDLSDPEDVKITVASQPAGSEPAPNGGAVLIHLGDVQFLERYKLFISHIADWRQQYPQLDSVDLRYGGQVVVNPEAGRPSIGKIQAGKQRR